MDPSCAASFIHLENCLLIHAEPWSFVLLTVPGEKWASMAKKPWGYPQVKGWVWRQGLRGLKKRMTLRELQIICLYRNPPFLVFCSPPSPTEAQTVSSMAVSSWRGIWFSYVNTTCTHKTHAWLSLHTLARTMKTHLNSPNITNWTIVF